ncbi:hypothetical protein RF11_02915 [Thelohanellus kitauei]|uniref:Uncharacterized protein n=1 Tax=Thelohanellus kitauei TaxID=669202 RepID=A0A0C2MVI8_THEKT|nr:hypothetical protein RF11_02915 [Thelohanellus kitauei]
MKCPTFLFYRMMIFSAFLILLQLPKSNADFEVGETKCFQASTVEFYKFTVLFSKKVNFIPTTFSMKINSLTFRPSPWDSYDKEQKYVMVEYAGGCPGSKLVLFRHMSGADYYSFSFVTFHFGQFVIEDYKIDGGETGTGNVVGILERTSTQIEIRVNTADLVAPSTSNLNVQVWTENMNGRVYIVKFMNYLDPTQHVTYFVPSSGTNLHLPKSAVIELAVVDKKGELIENVLPILDLVQITLQTQPSVEKPAKLFFSSDLKKHFVRVKLFDHERKVQAMAIHSLADGQAVPALEGLNSTFKSLQNTEVTNAQTLSTMTGFNDKSMRFMTTVSRAGSCNEGGKKAFVVRHKKGDEVVSKQSRGMKSLTGASKIFFQTKLSEANENTCGLTATPA